MISPQTVTADELISELPLVNAAAVAAAGGTPDVPAEPTEVDRAETAAPPDDAPAALLDDKGTPYDSERHLPVMHPTTGVWMPRRRPASATAAAEAAAPSFVAPDLPPALPPPADLAGIAADTCIGIIQTAFVMLGEDEGVLSSSERTMLRAPLERVLRKYSIGGMPAELDLAVAISMLVIARLKKPKTMARWERLKVWWSMRAADRRGHQQAAAISRAVA